MKENKNLQDNSNVSDIKRIIENQCPRLGENIQCLREIYEEDRKPLADAIGVSSSAISNYEYGIRFPNVSQLIMIARHFNVTIDSLLYSDFTYKPIENDMLINDPSNLALILSTLLPILVSDEALENSKFAKAYDLHCEIYNSLCNGDTNFALCHIDRCITLYKEALDDNIIEARANLLWWPMCVCIKTSSRNKKPKETANLHFKDATYEDELKETYLLNLYDLEETDWEEEQNEIISLYRESIINNIHLLKTVQDLTFRELADYYTALAYKFNIIGNERLTKEQSREIGNELLHLYFITGNPYVKDYYSVFKPLTADNNSNNDNK